MRHRAVAAPPVLAFDVNGVLADANSVLLPEVKARYAVSIAPEDLTSYGTLKTRLKDVIGDEALRWLKKRVNDPEFILALPPYPGVDRILELSPLPVRVVTGHSHAPETVAATERWLALNGLPVRCDFTAYKDGWCRQVRARWLVEDAPKHAVSCSEAGTNVILMDRPYNRDLPFRRASSLLDALRIVREDGFTGDTPTKEEP